MSYSRKGDGRRRKNVTREKKIRATETPVLLRYASSQIGGSILLAKWLGVTLFDLHSSDVG